MTRSIFRTLLVALFVISPLIIVGCGSSASSNQPNPVGPSITFTASPATIEAGQLVTIAWQTSGATSVSIAPNPNDDDDGTELPLSGSRSISLDKTTTFVLTATGPAGTRTTSVTVTVTHGQPTISLIAVPASILPGQESTLTWASSNASTIVIDNGVGTFTQANGTATVKPSVTTTYTATATGPGGTSTSSATVTVSAANELAITLTATPTSISKGGKSTLTWRSQNAITVRIDPQIGPVNLAGTIEVTPAATTSYTAIASGANGSTRSATATVTVLGSASGLQNLKHIIFFVQENRSFDNYFGKINDYRAARGLGRDANTFDPGIVLYDYYGHGVKPFHQRTVFTENLSPAWSESHFYVNRQNGSFKMDAWMKQSTPSIPSSIDPHYTRTMGYYDCTDIPFYCDVVTEFATSDSFHSSALSGTVVNRTYLFSATSAGIIRPSNPFPAELPTIFRLLSEAGISWRYYYQDGSVFLANYTKPGGCSTCDWDKYMKNVWNISNYYDILSRPTADHDLPQVIFIQHSSGEKSAATALDEHPSHNVQKGVAQSEKIIRALLNSPAWPTSAFILSHDEGGGLYDHVPPYSVANPDGIKPLRKSGDAGSWDDFTYSGFRVPLMVISPWVKPHYVSHVNREFSSILKLIETRFNLQPLTRRDAEADDMTEMFDFSQPHLLNPPQLAVQPVNGVADIKLEADPNHPK